MDWYTAGTMLAKQRSQGVATSSIAAIPYFENLFPGAADNLGYDSSLTSTQAVYQLINDVGGDYTTTQAYLDGISISGGECLLPTPVWSSECMGQHRQFQLSWTCGFVQDSHQQFDYGFQLHVVPFAG